MYGVCLRYSKDATEAEDNLQEGFIRVFTKIDQFQFKGSFEGWMRRIMVNTSLEKFRKQNNLYPVEDIAVYEGKQLSEDLLAQINANELLKLVQELPARYRMVFNLYAIEGFSHKEIGEMMGISEGTSKSNLSRARVILQKKVYERFGVERSKVNNTIC
ncbi:DNA-directed RNA polymerase sigma-70 factor [Prolixibacter denitrificans]|nr:DNA-directed RNA polymerase sigma-70 factor [Prolixibacter denitrificans]